MKKIISLILIGIMLISSCLIIEAAGSVSLNLPDKIYSNITELEAICDDSLSEVTFRLDGKVLGTSADGILPIESGTITPGYHTLEAVALYSDDSAAVDKKYINVYKAFDEVANPFTLGSQWNVADNAVTEIPDPFDSSNTENVYKVGFSSSQKQQKFTLESGKEFNCQYGDIVKTSVSLSADSASDFKNDGHLGFIITGTTLDGTSLNYNTAIDVGFGNGSLRPNNNSWVTVPSDYTEIPATAKAWNKYEFCYAIGRGRDGDADYVPNKLSVYKNGTPIFEDHAFLIKDSSAINKITGIALFERGRKMPLYFKDISVAHYMADYGVEDISYSEADSWISVTDGKISSEAENLKLKFASSMSKQSLTASNISLVSDKGTKTISSVTPNTDGSEITLTVAEGFEKGEKLSLVLSENIQKVSGDEVGEKLYISLETEAAPLTPSSVDYSKSGEALVAATQIKNGDSISVTFDLDIPASEPDNKVVAYLCVRENNRLVSITPKEITGSANGLTITGGIISGLKGEGSIEVKLMIFDDFAATVPYSMLKLE